MKLLTNKNDYLYPKWWERAARFTPKYREYCTPETLENMFDLHESYEACELTEDSYLQGEDFAFLEDGEEKLSESQCRMMVAQEELQLKHYEFTRENGLKGNLIRENDHSITILLENDTDRRGYDDDIQYKKDINGWVLYISHFDRNREDDWEVIEIGECELARDLDAEASAKKEELANRERLKAEKDILNEKVTAILVNNPLLLDWPIKKVKEELGLDISGLKEYADNDMWNPLAFYFSGLSCFNYPKVKNAIQHAKKIYKRIQTDFPGHSDAYILENFPNFMSKEYMEDLNLKYLKI